jgi:hypothetical protein
MAEDRLKTICQISPVAPEYHILFPVQDPRPVVPVGDDDDSDGFSALYLVVDPLMPTWFAR